MHYIPDIPNTPWDWHIYRSVGVVIQGAPIYIGPVPWMLWGMRMVGRAKMGLMGPWMILQSPGLGSFGVRSERFRSGHRSFFPHGYDTSQHPLVFIWFQWSMRLLWHPGRSLFPFLRCERPSGEIGSTARPLLLFQRRRALTIGRPGLVCFPSQFRSMTSHD